MVEMKLNSINLPTWLALILSLFSVPVIAQDPIRPYPLADSYLSSTSLLNHSSYLEGFDDQQWYLDVSTT